MAVKQMVSIRLVRRTEYTSLIAGHSIRLSVRETVLMKRRGGPTSFAYVLVIYGILGAE